VSRNGYHFGAMDAQGGTFRPLVAMTAALLSAAALAAPSHAQSSATGTPTGAPKILLAFDASGSMRADDGTGTPKIKAAQDGAVSLLKTLPATTQLGLRVFGGTLPSQPRGPACHDSKLVLPIGPLNRGQVEAQIRSFKARGRTPIAYALQQAANDLGASGSRTIVLVSDGQDTCQPPSPCAVARRIAKGGVAMRIQAIGFNVDKAARRQLKCIAKAGGGVYRDASNAASLRQELQTLATRALRQYQPRGTPISGGPNVQHATLIAPGRYVDRMLPDSTHWFAVDLRRGETLQASMSIIPPKRTVADNAGGSDFAADIETPSFDIPSINNSSADETPFSRRGYVDGIGVVSRPIGVGAQADPAQPFSRPGRYYLRLKFTDNSEKSLYNATGGQPYAVELQVAVLGRRGGVPSPAATPTGKPAKPPGPAPPATVTPQQPPSGPLLAAVGFGLAAVGFAGGAGAWWRRRR
jgi:von Willebrand factor type A domain